MIVTEQQYDKLNQRYEEYKEAGLPNLDPGLIRAVKLINQIDGLVSIFGCEGHFHQDGGQEYYIIMVCRDHTAYAMLHNIFLNVANRIAAKHALQLSHFHLIWPIYGEEQFWYPVVKLGYTYDANTYRKFEKHKHWFSRTLQDAIKSVINKLKLPPVELSAESAGQI